ncbi:MAG: hypothetical protein R3E79_18445 [Caldilineaceae bacterium]
MLSWIDSRDRRLVGLRGMGWLMRIRPAVNGRGYRATPVETGYEHPSAPLTGRCSLARRVHPRAGLGRALQWVRLVAVWR